METRETSIFQTSLLGRRSLPRRILKALVSPFYMIYTTGHFKNCLTGYAIDKDGLPTPMLTYPALDFLYSIEKNLVSTRVLEFGAGQSTLWFHNRVKEIISVEKSEEFRKLISKKTGENSILIAPEDMDTLEGSFDIILIDGYPRLKAGKIAIENKLLQEDGMIIVDNSDVVSLRPLLLELAKSGFYRVDYYGFSPSGVRPQCTSILCKSTYWFTLNTEVRVISANSETENLS